MNNLFPFEYEEKALFNQDGTESNFRQVFGFDGLNVVCPKSSYHVVKTADISALGQAFINEGYDVSTFFHRSGEKIGLNITIGGKKTVVGDCSYNLIITVPNNGGGMGYLSIKQTRLICTNGMVSNKTIHKDNQIKIPHTINYNESIELMKQSIKGFLSLAELVEGRDAKLNELTLTDTEVLFNLNKWFYEQELPKSGKEDLSFNEFRKLLAVNPMEVPYYARYTELKEAYNRELTYNKELGLDLTFYTVYATVTNYLSRRNEKSQSSASNEVKFERSSKKLDYFDTLV